MTAKETEGFIQVTGGKVWYRITGDGPGVPLLMLHGGPGGMSMDDDPLRELGKERRVIQYDQLGSGRSERPDEPSLWTVERYVEELDQVIGALGLEQIHLLGHSWGTMLAAAYLLTKSSGVQRVIFSSPCLNAGMWERDQREYLRQFPKETQEIVERSEREGTTDSPEYQEAMMAYYEQHMCRVVPWPENLQKMLRELNRDIYSHMWGASEFTVTGTLKNFDVTGQLNEINVPALFTCGLFDEATEKSTLYYASLMSEAEVAVLKNSSHMPGIEEPEAYVEIIREFLNR